MLSSKGIGNLFKVILLVGLSLLFMTCDPGLGKAVDTQAPKVSISLPVTKSVLKGGFTMKGVASDEIKVESCTVTFKNIETSQEKKFTAEVENGEFSVNINTPSTEGTFELPDGDYNVTVTVTDAYHQATADVVYTIDNTSPTVLLTSPNVYVESNWPSMYKIFTIKGEVYDFTTISEVKVFIVDSEGKVIVEQIAEGTNTFLASFDNPGIPTGKTCFYYAVAKDAGGNENTYCYHKQDIYALISQQQKNSTFPSINAIGYVDQNVEDTFNGSIDKNLLGAKKIENVKPGAEKGSRPGFDFFDKDTAQIKWMNISDESLAGIGIGTPILGTIMPPTDGSAVLDVKVWLVKGEKISDNEFSFPEYTDSDEIETCWLSYDDEGNIKDEKQCKLSSVGDSVNFQIDSHDVGSEDEWPSALYKIKVQFITNSDMEGYAECKFQVTSGAPKLTEGNFSSNPKASYYRGFMTAKTLEPSSDEKNYLKGVSRTSDDSAKVSLYYEFTGSSDGNNYAEMDEYGNYKIEIPIDAVNHTKDGEYTYTLTSKVSELLSTVISRVVVIDTTNPTIEFTTLSNGDIIESSEFNLKGNVEDANGISLVEYQLLADSSQILIDGSQTNGWQVIPNAKSSFNLSLSNLKEDVTYTVKIRATDMAGNISEDEKYKCSFTIDLAEPVATIDSPAPEADSSIVFTNQIPTFSGKAIDNAKTNGKVAKSASLSFRKDGGSVTEVPAGTGEGQFNWNKNSGEWTWTPTSSQFNGTGKYDVTLKVTDTAEKSISVTRTVSLDNSVPTIKLTQVSSYVERENPEDGYYVNGEISVKFDITENDYIKEIKWYKPNGSVDSQNLGTNAQPTVVIKTTDFDDGTKLGEFKLVVTDRSGNEGVYTGEGLLNYEINQDSDKPTIEISGINENITTVDGISKDDNLFSTGDSLSLTFKDDDGVASAKYRIDSASEKTINGGNVKVKTDNISLNGLTQGSHTIKVTVTDTNGNTISTNTIYFGIDDKSPELNIDGYSETDIDVGFKSSNFEITGTVTDTYELKDLVYSYSDTPDVKTKIRDGNGNWNLSITKPNSSEKKTITFVASDKFLRTTVKTFTYIFDLDKPNLIIPEEQKTAITDKYFNQNSMVTLSGTANDISGDTSTQSGIKIVQYGLGKGHDATSADTLAYQNANGSTEWTVLLNIPTFKDGKYTLFVKSVDNSGNESDVQKFNITADSTAPILTVGGSSDASGTSYASGDLNLSGTVADETLLNLTYTYTLNGQEQESDVVINTSGSGNEKTWSLSKGELGDGTHVFKIFATDKAGNQTSLTRNIIVDTEAPVITTNVSPLIMYNNGNGEEETVNGTINVNVRVSETNKLKGVYYTLTESDRLDDAADWSSKVSFNDTELATGKTITIVTTNYDDGTKLPLRIKAVDEAGNYRVVNVNPVVNQESDKPAFVPSNIKELANENAAGWTGGNPSNVFSSSNPNMIFTLSDDDSVKEYWVKVDNNDFVKVSDVNSTQKIVTYPVKDLDYGRHTITFRVVDEYFTNTSTTKNNYVEKTYYIAIDYSAPDLKLINKNNQYVGNSFEISGTVTDENGVDFVTLQSESENVYATLGLGSGLNNDGTFSYTFVVPNVKEAIKITAVDKIGNSSSETLTYLVDSTKPTLSITTDENAFVDGDLPSLRIAGTVSDDEIGVNDTGSSGIDQVRLKIGSSITGVNDADSVLAAVVISDDESTWSYNLDFTGKDAGSYKVYAKAFDIAGNESAEDSITVYVDTDAPQLSHGYTDNFVGVYKGDFVIQGTATDASGVKSVTAKIQGASGNLTGPFTETSNNSPASWNFTIPANSGDGQLTILVTAKDGCGKSVQETFTATLDTKVPEVTFTDISDDDNNNETIETSKTNDKPSVSVTYSDITSGVKTIEYSFYYFDKIKGTFVNYATEDPNASGTFTRGSSFSGSVKLRMAEQTTTTSGPFIFSDTYTDGKWYVNVTVTDEAGNVATYDSPYFYVDQHKPILDVVSPVDLSLKKENDSLTVKGTTKENFNGEIDRVVVKVTHPNYNSSQLEQFTKTFTKDVRIGTELLTSKGNETYEFSYEWDEANSPFSFPNEYEIIITTYDVAGNEVSLPKKVSCDKTAPTISFTRPYSYSVDSYGKVTVGAVVNSPIGDTSIKALASDTNMKNIYYQIGGTVTVDADGTLGDNDYKIKTLTVTGGGVGSDNHGTSVDDVKFDDVKVSLFGKWNKLTNANLDFDVSYNTLNFNNNKMTYHVDGDKETIMTLDVHFVAVDSAGNINYCKMPIKVDTDTDKPNLLVLSPKTINDVANVGGTATVSGTVNDDNGVHSVLMQVELVNGKYNGNILEGFGINYSQSSYGMVNPQVLVENNDGTYSLDNNTSYFADKTKWYRVNLSAQNSTSTTWNMVLNKNKEFDNSSLWTNGYLTKQVEQTELIVRVRALDTKSGNSNISTDAKLGDISEFTLRIDSGSPSIVINNIADFPTEGSYIGGTLNFDIDFSDDEKITEWTIEAFSTASGDNRTKVIASGKYSGNYKDGIDQTVHVEESVNTEDIYGECGNVIQIKISAKDNSTSGDGDTETPKESYLTFKYTIDNSAPQANNVATIDGNSYLIDTETVIGDSGSHRETEIRGKHLRIMSDQAAFKGSVFDEANGSGVDYVMLYFTKGEDLYNPSKEKTIEPSYEISVDGENIKFPVASLNDVVRTISANGGKPTPYIIVDRAEGMIDSGANGDLDGYDENLKANGEWVVYIKSSNLPDGIYKIHYVVVDHAKNVRYYQDSMLVQNHAPKITSIVLATDINGDGTVDISADGTSDEDKKFDTSMGFKDTGFNVRNSKLKIKVNVTGGKEPLKYFLRYKTTSGEVTTDENDPGYSTGIFEVTSFLGDSSTPVDYVVWVLDSVEDDLSLSSGETTIDMIMDNVDDIKPVAQFFELNTIVENSSASNSNRGSLYKDDSVKGHIEPRQNSPVDNTSGKDPDVSGTIILRGEAMDNQRIKSIVLNLNGTNVTIAEWDSETKQLLGKNNAVVVDDLGLAGHYVEWSYAWNTNAITKYNVPVVVIVNDASSKESNSTEYSSTDNKPRTNGDGGTVDNRFNSDGWGYSSMTVDAVPYITAVARGNEYNTNRAKSGAIPMLRGQWSNRIEGFNLGSNLNNISVEFTENKDGTGNIYSVTEISTDGSYNLTTFQVPVASRDGYLSTIVNGIRSINNINDNSQEYNREGNEYNANSKYWTDDRYVRIWQNNNDDYFPGSGNPVYPAMSIGSNGDLYASFSNYTDAAVYYSQRGGSKTKIFAMYDPSEETDIHISGTGTVNVAYSANYQGGGDANWTVNSGDAGGIYVYDTNAKGKKYSDTYGSCKFIKHELFYHNKMLQQFKNIRVKRSNTAPAGFVHIAYYDRLSSSIHYSNSPGNTQHNAGDNECSWVNIDGGTDEHDTNTYKDGSSIALSGNAFETGVSRAAGTGEYVGLALTKSRFPVLVYFDSANKVLKLARANQENPKGNNGYWKVQSVIKDTSILGASVESITCDIDSDGKIHIAFQNGKNQLVYIKSTNASANGSSSYTFDAPVVVAEGASWVDLTLYGTTPYISYLSGVNSYDGMNLAFFDKTIDTNFDGVADGAWEAMVAPLAHKATSIRTCVEVHPKMTTSGIDWEAAIGFTPGDFYRLAFYIGSGKGH